MEQMIASWSMVKVHGLMVVGPSILPKFTRSWGPEWPAQLRLKCSAQPGYLARPTTKTPETQIYFINHRSGANSVPGGTVSAENGRSIVNRTTVLWSIWMVASLILAGPGIAPF